MSAAPRHETLVHALLERAEREPSVEFASFEGRVDLTLAELADAIRRFASAITERGVTPGERVLLALDNSPEVLVAWLGSWHAGATVVPLVPDAGERIFARAAALMQPRLAVTDARGAKRLRAADVASEILVVEEETSESLALSLRSFLADGSSAEPTEPLASGDMLASVMFTSGTTGPPKGVRLVHRWYTWASSDVAGGMSYGPVDVLYTCLPLGHANAQDTTFGPALLAGARVAFDRRFSASRFWQRLERTGATAFNLIGNMPRVLLNRPDREYAPGHRARRAFAIPALPHYVAEFRRRFGVELLQGYGSTEIGVPVFQDAAAVQRGSCGLPLGGTELRIEGEDGSERAVGEAGEILVRSSRPGAITDGYYGDPERSAAAWRGGWFHTGDLGRVDADGHLYFVGRLGDALRRKGENLSAHEIEAVILEMDGVLECAVVGRRGDDGDHEVIAFVVPDEGAHVDVHDLTDRCVRSLGTAAAPSQVVERERLPRTESGKVAKGRLVVELQEVAG